MSCVNFTGLVNEDSQVLAELKTLFPEKNESDYRDIKELLPTKIQESNSEFGKFLQLEKIDRGQTEYVIICFRRWIKILSIK